MSYPGEEIPKWFNYQMEGCSMNIMLPYNPNFMGFAFCVIVEPDEYMNMAFPSLECEINVKTIYDNERHFQRSTGLEMFFHQNPKSLQYVFMTTFMIKEDSFSSAKEMSFNFRIKGKMDIKRCGVRILYVEDAKDFGIGRFQKSMLEQLHYFQVSPSKEGTL